MPLARRRSRMCGTAAAASSRSTVMRTNSEPARASAATCRAVASMSAVSVLVMDCTTIGAPPPTTTAPGPAPTRTPTVPCRARGPKASGASIVMAGLSLGRRRAAQGRNLVGGGRIVIPLGSRPALHSPPRRASRYATFLCSAGLKTVIFKPQHLERNVAAQATNPIRGITPGAVFEGSR